jgi:signal transduction histidine kinase
MTRHDRARASRTRWQHDLKNQLGIILGFSDLLLQGLGPDDPSRADIQEIHAAALRAMELVRAGARPGE